MSAREKGKIGPFDVSLKFSREQLLRMRTPLEWKEVVVAPLPPPGRKLLRPQEEATSQILHWHCEPLSLSDATIGPRVSRQRIDRLVYDGALVWRGSPAEIMAARIHRGEIRDAPPAVQEETQTALI